MLAGSGSAMIAANSRSASAASRASRSFHGTTIVSAACASVTPGARRDPRGRQARAGLGKQPIDMPVIGARELQHRVAPGGSARQAERAHRRLGPGRSHAHHLNRGEPVTYLGCELDLALGRRAVRGAALGSALNRIDYVGMRVAQDQRSPRAHPVDVAVPVDIDQLEALAALDKDRMVAPDGAHRPHGRVHPTGHQPSSARIYDLRSTGIGPRLHSSARMGTDPKRGAWHPAWCLAPLIRPRARVPSPSTRP